MGFTHLEMDWKIGGFETWWGEFSVLHARPYRPTATVDTVALFWSEATGTWLYPPTLTALSIIVSWHVIVRHEHGRKKNLKYMRIFKLLQRYG
jgi:hypothetical protein